MSRLHNPWPERGSWREPPRPRNIPEVRSLRAGDVELAREFMRGDHGHPLSLAQTAQQLGVLASDLDLALWRTLGSSQP